MKEGMRIIYTNADQLTNKLEELQTRIKIENPHIILVTEVNSKNTKNSPDLITFHIQGFQLFHQNVSTDGRGIIIYIHQSIKDVIEITPKTNFSENKIVTIKIGSNSELLVACIYRSESGTRENNENLLKLLTEIEEMKASHKLVIGDFNYKLIDWESWETPKSETSPEHCFINCIQDNYWYQHVTNPTRYREGDEPSILDLVFTNEENMIEKIDYQSPLGKSDHSLLSFKFKIKSNITFIPKTVFKYDRGNYNQMREDLNLDWQNQFNLCGPDTNKQWELLKSKIKASENRNVPSYKTTENDHLRKGKIPLSPGLRKEIRKKHRCWQRSYETKSSSKDQKWKQQRNRVSKLLREAERKFELDIANDCKLNPKKLWKYMKSKTRVKTTIPPLRDKNGKVSENNKQQAETLAAQFASVMVNEPEGDIPTLPDRNLETPPLSNIQVTEDMVMKKLQNLNTSKSPGPDEIHPRVLKENATVLAPALTLLYNNLLSTHTIPDEWRTAIISAIFKKGDKSDPGNYRPVSLTCIICKILESIIYDHIMKHLIKNNLLTKCQYGFISKRSAALQLLTVLELWCNILDEDGTIDNINMDFQKAFDTVPHQRLLGKLRSYGITGDVHKWLEAFLTNRKQKVQVNGTSSDWTDVTSGVPQGSVIAALLFVIFINDLPDNIKSHIFLFADDCKFFWEILSAEDTDVMQEDLTTLNEWSKKWLLTFHPDKCVNLRISLKKDPGTHTYTLGNNELKNVDEVKDLGVLVDRKLKFEKHTSVKVNKANQMWGVVKRAFKHMNQDIFKKLFCSHVRPHVEYAVQFWSPYLRKHINQVEQVQRRATKSIPGFRNLSYKERLIKLDLPTLSYRRLRGSMIEVFKILNVYDKEVTPQFHIKQSATRGHDQKIYVKTAKKHHPQHHSFHHRVANPWNSLPNEVIHSPNLNTFKNRLDNHWKNLPLKYDHQARDFEP